MLHNCRLYYYFFILYGINSQLDKNVYKLARQYSKYFKVFLYHHENLEYYNLLTYFSKGNMVPVRNPGISRKVSSCWHLPKIICDNLKGLKRQSEYIN